MDSIDRDILKYCSKRDNYYELKGVIDKSLCVKESWLMLTDFGQYFKEHPNEQEITDDFKMWQRIQRHPDWKAEKASQMGSLVDTVLGTPDPNRSSFMESLYHLRACGFYHSIGDDLEMGRITTEDAEAKARGFVRAKPDDETLVQLSLTDLATASVGGGYYWRLEDLNRSIGPIKKGDCVIIAKRPEVGGTSFLVSEMTHMLEQIDGNAIIFNNEEEPSKVYSRWEAPGKIKTMTSSKLWGRSADGSPSNTVRYLRLYKLTRLLRGFSTYPKIESINLRLHCKGKQML
jgi:hypothetical protein